MSAQTTAKTLTDEELDGVSGGAVGINPLLLLNSGGQGIYAASPEAHAPAAVGVNPLYVDHTAQAGNVAPVFTPTHDATPVPQATVPTHDTSVVPVGLSGPLNNGSLALAHQAISSAIPGGTAAAHAPTPSHDTTPVVVATSIPGMGDSLNIPAPTASHAPITITGTIHLSGDIGPVNVPSPESQVTVMTFATQPTTYTTVTPTVHGTRSATGDSAHPGVHGPLENAFDLSLVKQ